MSRDKRTEALYTLLTTCGKVPTSAQEGLDIGHAIKAMVDAAFENTHDARLADATVIVKRARKLFLQFLEERKGQPWDHRDLVHQIDAFVMSVEEALEGAR